MSQAGKPSITLTVERLREVLDYDPSTGVFIWLISPAARAPVGAVAGCPKPDGYRQIQVDGVNYRAHRLAWLWVHGVWPSGVLDHKDGYRDNNAINNLRPATLSQNGGNMRRHRDNVSGFKGACFEKRSRKWRGTIVINGKQRHLGLFATAEEAHAAYVRAAIETFGEFASDGAITAE